MQNDSDFTRNYINKYLKKYSFNAPNIEIERWDYRPLYH